MVTHTQRQGRRLTSQTINMDTEYEIISDTLQRQLVAAVFTRAMLDWRIYHRSLDEIDQIKESGEYNAERLDALLDEISETCDIQSWVRSDSYESFSYLYCCSLLGIDGRKCRLRIDELSADLERQMEAGQSDSIAQIDLFELEATLDELKENAGRMQASGSNWFDESLDRAPASNKSALLRRTYARKIRRTIPGLAQLDIFGEFAP
jgi:hypothetical protein